MTLHVQLPAEVGLLLAEQAERSGVPAEQVAREVLCREFRPGGPVVRMYLPLDAEADALLRAAAARVGSTPEQAAVSVIGILFRPDPPLPPVPPGESLADDLNGFIGAVEGPPGSDSRRLRDEFAEGLAAKQRMGRL